MENPITWKDGDLYHVEKCINTEETTISHFNILIQVLLDVENNLKIYDI